MKAPKLLQQLVDIRRSKMTQAEAARRMKITRQRLCNIERMHDGVPTLTTIERYAKAVGAKLAVISS